MCIKLSGPAQASGGVNLASPAREGNIDPKWEPSFDIVQRGRISLYAGSKCVGFIDIDPQAFLPGVTFFTPPKKLVEGEERERVGLRDRAYEVFSSCKDDKDLPKIDELAKAVRRKKQEALKRDASLVFGDPHKPTPNATVARAIIAATRAIKQVYAPAYGA